MAEYEIYALKYAGPFTSSGAFLMWKKDWEKQVQRNYYFWCVRGEKETVIIDAGIPPKLARERNLAGYVSPVEVLSRIGVRAEEVRHLILTHIHWDHSSGVGLFRDRPWLDSSAATAPPPRPARRRAGTGACRRRDR